MEPSPTQRSTILPQQDNEAGPRVDRLGQRLGSYRLVKLLGAGGFAEVYLGEHIHLGTQAAIKILHARLAKEDQGPFRQEARIVARLRHPHIVSILDFAVQDDVPFLVMDYAPNGTLRQRHPRSSRVQPETILGYLRQAAEALQYAHNERLVHCDVKPENLLIGRKDEILISDFGIAVVVQSTRFQSQQEVAGTLLYGPRADSRSPAAGKRPVRAGGDYL